MPAIQVCRDVQDKCAKRFPRLKNVDRDLNQGLVKGAILCSRNPYFYFCHGESTSTASQKSNDLNKVPLLLQDLAINNQEKE